MKKLWLLVLSGALFFIPLVTHAQFNSGLGQLDKAVGPSTNVGLQGELTPAISTIVTTALSLVGTIFLLLTIYGGIRWMLARGDEAEIEKGKEIIKAAIIGLVIVMSAYAITAFVGSRLSGSVGNTGVDSGGNVATQACVTQLKGKCVPADNPDGLEPVPNAAGSCPGTQRCVKS